MSPSEQPRFRATDMERNRVLALLQQALSDGQLNFAEFDERSQAITTATYRDELLDPLRDLIPHPEDALAGRLPSVHGEAAAPASNSLTALRQVSEGAQGDAFSLALLSGVEKKGAWVCSPTHTSIAVMGGAELDLREAVLASSTITIRVLAVMGGIEIVVPKGVRVITRGLPLMGGFGSTLHGTNAQQLPADAPTIIVEGIAFWGGVSVTDQPS